MSRIRLCTLAIASLITIVASTGCISVGTMQRASTLGQGHFQWDLEGDAWGVAAGKAADSANITLPSIGAAVRYGVTDNIDISGRFTFAGVEFGAKFQLTPPGYGIILSLAPSIGGLGIAAGSGGDTVGVGYLNAQLPLLIGVPFGPHELVIGPKLIDYALFAGASGSGSAAAGGNLLFVGGSVGVAFRITPGFQLLPEVAIAYPVVGTVGAVAGGSSASTTSALNADGLVYQVGLGFLFGG